MFEIHTLRTVYSWVELDTILYGVLFPKRIYCMGKISLKIEYH